MAEILKYHKLELRKTPPNHLIPYLQRWVENGNINKLGVLQFGWELFPDLINHKYGIADWVYSAMHKVKYYEAGMTKEDRCTVIATYRSGSKTTWFVIIDTLYDIMVGQYGVFCNGVMLPEAQYQVIRGKTSKETKKRLFTIANLTKNPNIINLFGDLTPSFKAVKDKAGKDTGDLIIFTNQYILEGSGFEQPSRGMNVLGVRPDKFVFDDPENMDNTKTLERRINNRREVMEESFGAVDDDGSITYIGNKVNEDDAIGHLLSAENKSWKKLFFTFTYLEGENGERLAGSGNLDIEKPSWVKRYPISLIRKRKEWFETQPELGGLKAFLKEYYNIIKSDADYKVNYYNAELVRQFGINWLVFDTEEGKKYHNVYIVIGCDPAISERKTACDASIVAVAFASNKKRYVLKISKGKYDIHDRYYDNITDKPYLAVAPDDLAKIKRKGSVEEMVRMALELHADAIVVETAGQQRTFYNELKDMLETIGKPITVMPYTTQLNKIDKLRQNPLAYFESNLYYLKSDMKGLQSEIVTFPHSRLDTLDAIHNAEILATIPSPLMWNPLGIFNHFETEKPHDSYAESNQYADKEEWIIY